MYKIGFKFEVTKNGITGIINGVVATDIYSVAFYYKNGRFYYCASVYEETITNNLKIGAYKEIA